MSQLFEIIPGKLYQSSCPFGRLINVLEEEIGINVVVDLAGLSILYENYMKPETQLLSFHIVDRCIPQDRKTFKQFINKIIELYKIEGKIILVHCQGGRGRSTIGTSCLYGILNNVDGNEAIRYIGEKTGMNVPETNEQTYFICRFIRKFYQKEELEKNVGVH